MGEAVLDLARRADVEADGLGRARRAEGAEAGQDLGSRFALRAARMRYGTPVAASASRSAHDGLVDALEVVDEERRAVLARQRLGVAARDPQPPVDGAQTGVTATKDVNLRPVWPSARISGREGMASVSRVARWPGKPDQVTCMADVKPGLAHARSGAGWRRIRQHRVSCAVDLTTLEPSQGGPR